MAIQRPDIYEHNNSNLAISDTDFHKGGFRTAVGSLTDLYALSGKTGYDSAPGQLKEHSTVVYVSGETKYYILIDIGNVNNINGWEPFLTSSGTTGNYLSLNQTTPQNVINGQPIFDEGIIIGENPSSGQITGHTVGKMYYDKEYETVSIDIGVESKLQLGQEIVRYVYNDTASVILNGSIVRISGVYNGSGVDTVTVGLAIASGVTESDVFGIATQDIGIDGFGYVAINGNVNNLNTLNTEQYSGMTVGDTLFLSPIIYGGVTNVPPVSPNVNVEVGRLITMDAVNGKICVNITPLLSVNDLLDASTTNPSVDDVLTWNGVEWVNAVSGSISAGASVDFYYSTPVINSVTLPAGISEDGTSGNGIQVMTLTKTPVTTGSTQVVSGDNISDIRAFASWCYCDQQLQRTVIDAGTWEFYDYLYVDSAVGDTRLIHQMYQSTPISGGTITISGGDANSREAIISSHQFTGTYFSASTTNTIASYLKTPSGIFQISSQTDNNQVTIIVPTGYVNETAVSGGTWNKLFSATTPEIEQLSTPKLYGTAVAVPEINISLDDNLGQIMFINNVTSSRTVYLSYNDGEFASFFKTPLVTLHNSLGGLQGGVGDERYHSTLAEYLVLQNTSNINTGDETKATIEAKLIGEILTHTHPYSGITNTPDLSNIITGATNGLTSIDHIVVLGGALTGNTIINGNGSSLTISGNTDLVFDIDVNRIKIGNDIDSDNGLHIDTTSYQLFNYSGSNGTYISGDNTGVLDISVDSNNISNTIGLGGINNDININTISGVTRTDMGFSSTSIIITSNYNVFEGVVYNNDYSSNFVNRSLVDKEYVDSEICSTSNVINVTPIINNTYSVQRYDEFIAVSGLSANEILLYSNPLLGQRITVVDICGNALADPIVINGQSELINDDFCSTINTDYGATTFIYNGYFWSTVAFIN